MNVDTVLLDKVIEPYEAPAFVVIDLVDSIGEICGSGGAGGSGSGGDVFS